MAEKAATINRVTARDGEITISSNHKSNSILSSSSLTERKQIMATGTIEIKAVRVQKINGNNRLKGFVDISINDVITLKGLKVIQGENGLFVGMPSDLNKSNNRYYESIRCTSKEIKEDISNTVLAAFARE